MDLFVNVFYNEITCIIRVAPSFEDDMKTITTEDFHRAVKSSFCIDKEITFYDKKTSCVITDDFLVGYVMQFTSSPGWILGVADADAMPKRKAARKTVQQYVLNTVTAETLRNLKEIDFRIIYASYEKNLEISNGDKIKLSKIMIKFLLEDFMDLKLAREDFFYLANIICEVFPCENPDVYYTSATEGQKPYGKLYDAFCNCRKALCSAGLISRRAHNVQRNQDPLDN